MSRRRCHPETKNHEPLDEVIAKFWKEQCWDTFEIEEEDNAAVDDAILHRATKIVKEIKLLGLNHGIATLNLGGVSNPPNNDNNTKDAFTMLMDLLVSQYAPACLAMGMGMAVTTEGIDPTGGAEDTVDVSRRLLQFIAAVVVAIQSVDNSIDVSTMVKLATDASLASSDGVRSFACSLLGYLGAAEPLIPRLTDKAIPVRAAAILACGQILNENTKTNGNTSKENDSANNDDDAALLEALLWNVWHEPSVPNRVAAVQALPVRNDVWDHVIARLRDVKPKVRVAALKALHQTQSLDQLTSTQMAEILQSGIGLEQRCQATKDAMAQLVCSHWMKLAKFNALNLLQAIDVLVHDEEAEYAVRLILTETVRDTATSTDYLASLSPPEKRAFQSSISNHLATLEESTKSLTTVTIEQYFLGRVAGAHHQEYLTNVVPDMGVLCDVFEHFSRQLLQSISEGNTDKTDYALFISVQLLQMATLVGMEEEGSRRRFTTLLQAILTTSPAAELPEELVETAVKALLTLYGCIADDRQGKVTIGRPDSSLGTVLQGIVDHLCGLLTAEDSTMAPLCFMRILSVYSIALEEVNPRTGILRDFFQGASPIVQRALDCSRDNDFHLLREAAVSCLGRLGLFTDKAVVLSEHKSLLLKVACDEDEPLTVRSQAMMALTDWALVFDEILQPIESGVSLVDLLKALLDSTHTSVAAIAAEATAKLLFANRLCDSNLIAQLLVLYFDPHTKESSGPVASIELGSTTRLQQCLSLFFPTYCLQSAQARDAVLGSIECALTISVTRVRKTKKKVAFPVVKLVEYVCEVVTVAHEEALQGATNQVSSEMDDEHDVRTVFMIAIQVAQFVLTAEEQNFSLTVTQLRGLCKLLGSLAIQSTPGISKLQQIMEELGMVLTDFAALRYLTPLVQELSDLREEPQPEGDEEAEDNDDEGNVTSSRRKSSASSQSTLTEVTGRPSNASTITDICLEKENSTSQIQDKKVADKKEKPLSSSSRVTRNTLKYRNAGP